MDNCEVSKAFKEKYGSGEAKDVARLATLEAKTDENTKNIGRINDTLDNLFTKIGKFESNILDKMERTQSNRQITAPLILSCIGVIISLALVSAMLVNGAMEPMKLDIVNLKTNVQEHHLLPGHVEALEFHAGQKEQLRFVEHRLDKIDRILASVHTSMYVFKTKKNKLN